VVGSLQNRRHPAIAVTKQPVVAISSSAVSETVGAIVAVASAAGYSPKSGDTSLSEWNSRHCRTVMYKDGKHAPAPREVTQTVACQESAMTEIAIAESQIERESSPAQPSALDSETRAEVTRVVLHGVSQAGLDDNDRAYLAQVVSARTGLPPDEAKRRVAMVESKARDAVNEAADKTAKAAAYFSFWTFMSLLFGGVAATLAGILGGQLRDGEGRLAQAG
jgi:hypothetical protein